MRSGLFTALVLATAITGCFKRDPLLKADKDKSGSSSSQTNVKTTNDENGADTGLIKGGAADTQVFAASAENTIAGTTVTFPPGALAIDTEISLESGASIASEVSGEFGFGGKVSETGTAVAIQSSIEIDALVPFRVALSLPAGAALTDSGEYPLLVVLYKVKIAADGSIVVGILPRSQIEVINGVVTFNALNFGVFQTATLKVEVAEKFEQKTSIPIITQSAANLLAPAVLTRVSRQVIAPTTRVDIFGNNFRASLVILIGKSRASQVEIVSSEQARFVVPTDESVFGLVSLSISQDGVSAALPVFFQGKTDFPLIDRPESQVCAGEKYYDLLGKLRLGVKACGTSGAANTPCTASGQTGCLATSSFKAVNVSQIQAANIRAGITIAGVAGTAVPRPASCTSDGETSCVAITGYPAAKMANFSTGSIKRGVQIAGVVGNFPSSTFPLPRYVDGGSTTDVSGADEADLINFTSQLTSDSVFEYWDSTGTRRTGNGDSDLQSGNIKIGVNLENISITGTYAGSSLPARWDVRAGVNRGDGQMGLLKTDCRNSIKSTTYNYDGSVLSIPATGIATGSVFDVWDTIDDQAGQPPATGFPAGWSMTNNYCGGLEAALDDGKVWRDVTTGSCNGTKCRYKDLITGLEWSKTVASSRSRSQAINDCASLTHDSLSDWRLPTQKELMMAYVHGLRSAANVNWITQTQIDGYHFVSATSHNSIVDRSWYVDLELGNTNYTVMSSVSGHVTCVR